MFILLITGCRDESADFFGKWRENLGSESITFNKNKTINYYGQKGTFKAKFEIRLGQVFPRGGNLTVKLPNKTINFFYTFGDSKLKNTDYGPSSAKGDKKLLRLFNKATGEYTHLTKDDLSKSNFPNTLAAGLKHENNGLRKFEGVSDLHFTDNKTLAVVNRRAEPWNYYSEIFRKDGNKWSKLNISNLKFFPYGNSTMRFNNLYAAGKYLVLSTHDYKASEKNNSQETDIYFSKNEGDSFTKLARIFPNAKYNDKVLGTISYQGFAILRGNLYVSVIRNISGENGDSKGINDVYRMDNFENYQRSSWKKVHSYESQIYSSGRLQTDGDRLVVAHGSGFTTFISRDGNTWVKRDVPKGSQSYNIVINGSEDMILVGVYGTQNKVQIYTLAANDTWQKGLSLPEYSSFNTHSNLLYYNDGQTGEVFSVNPNSSLSTKTKLVGMTHPGRKYLRAFPAKDKIFFGSNQGFFSKDR